MENRNVTRSLKRQLDQVVLHEQVENGVAINNNMNVDQVDQWFETPRIFFQTKHRHLWIEESPIGHIMPHATLIILHEVQIGEA